jgi:hypothetical protein
MDEKSRDLFCGTLTELRKMANVRVGFASGPTHII